MHCSPDLPGLTYPHGAAMPVAVLGCPGGGTMSAFDDLNLVISAVTPGGTPLMTLTQAQITAGQDEIAVEWSLSDLPTLEIGTYGLTVIATLLSETQKWRGQLHVVAAAT